MDRLRIAVSEADAVASVTAEAYDRASWNGADQEQVERFASLLGLIARSASSAVAAFHALHGAVADAEPASAGEGWDYEGHGTAGGAEAVSAEDADIIRRIRERSPDGRYEGGSDAELIQLFQRNKRVLDRSDEDVIAAMTHPR
jgi:hypothetical protein